MACPATTSWQPINGSLTRLQTDYVDLYQAHRYDFDTPLEETMQAFADIVRQGKALYIGVSEWTADQIRDGHAFAKELGFQLISNQPQYSMLWRVIEAEVVRRPKNSDCPRSCLVPDGAGSPERQVPPRQTGPGRQPRDRHQGRGQR